MGGVGPLERREGEAVRVCLIELCELRGSPSGVNSVTFKLSQWVEVEVRSEVRGKLGPRSSALLPGRWALLCYIYTGVPAKMSFERKSPRLKEKYLKTTGFVHSPPLQRFN